VKVLSLIQPYATLAILGIKKNETRSRYTSHRGELGIHASASFPREYQDIWEELCDEWEFYHLLEEALHRAGFAGKPHDLPLPRGVMVGKVNLADRVSTNDGRNPSEDDLEYWLGNYGPDRFFWRFTNPDKLPEFVPVKGNRLLWEWDGKPSDQRPQKAIKPDVPCLFDEAVI